MPEVRVDAHDLRESLLFQSRGTVDDGYGNSLPAGDFVTVHEVKGNLNPLRGTESVMASRLQGRQPYILTVRQSSETRQVTPAWRVVDKNNTNRVFSINAPATDPDGKRMWHEFLVTEEGLS